MNIKPLYDRVVIKRMEEEKMSAGGIVIPDSATEKPIKGEVVAVGEGKVFDNGNVRAPKVKAGDKVLFGKYSGTEVKLDGTEYLVVKEDDIFAVLVRIAIPGSRTSRLSLSTNHKSRITNPGVKNHGSQGNPFR